MSFSKKAYYHHPKWNSPIHHSLLQSLFFITLKKCNYFAYFFFLVISSPPKLAYNCTLSIWKSSKCSVNSYLSECMHAHMLIRFSLVWLRATLLTVACQAPLSMGFSRQEYWSGLPCPPPRDLPHLGIELASLKSPALAGEFTTSATWEALVDE